MEIKTMNDLLVDMLKDMYSAETQLTKALEKMSKKASTPELKKGFENHLSETKEHVKRLEEACSVLGVEPRGKHCPAMENLIKEADEMIEEIKDQDVLDAALIAGAQKVEHYEISSYGTILTFAKMLKDNKVADILSKTIAEEKKTDGKLTEIAESLVNEKALQS